MALMKTINYVFVIAKDYIALMPRTKFGPGSTVQASNVILFSRRQPLFIQALAEYAQAK